MVIYPKSEGYRHLRALYALKKPLIYENISFTPVKTPELVFISSNPAPEIDLTSQDPLSKVKFLQYGSYTD